MSALHEGRMPNSTKRPRPVISCLECRRKKLKCDRAQPCQQCLKVGRPGRCQYQPGSEPEADATDCVSTTAKRHQTHSPSNQHSHGSLPRINGFSVGPTQQAKTGIIEDLQERVTRLENALLARDAKEGSLLIPQESSENHEQDVPLGAAQKLVADGSIDSLFPDACKFMRALQNHEDDPDLVQIEDDLRSLQRTLKAHNQNLPAENDLGQRADRPPLDLPPLHVCERLAVLYFDNMEHCFRILCWPDFRRQLGILFTDGLGPDACSFAFMPQLVGALAISTFLGTHEECEEASSYSLIRHSNAVRFMDEFTQGLRGVQRYQLPALQVKMLSLMCRWLGSDPLVDLFGLSGEIIRDALVMRMDQDPTTLPGVSIYEGELRRRSWMTIMEVDLMLSELCRLPCMVPPYTCRPPQNINDDEIYEGLEELPPSRPTELWTDGLCQYVLAKSFPHRLAACKKMESATQFTIDELLEHTRYMEKELQNLPPPLRFTYAGDEASKTPPRLMARMELDISIRRPLMYLYSCFTSAFNAEDIPQEARAGFLQSYLMLTNYQDLFDPQFSELNVPRPQGYWDFFHNVYRHELGQAILGLCLEIKRKGSLRQVQSESPDAHVSNEGTMNSTQRVSLFTRESLIGSVKETLEPMTRRLSRIKANLKDLIYLNIVFTSVLPQQEGQSKYDLIKRALQTLVKDCQVQLERDGVTMVTTPLGSEIRARERLDGDRHVMDARFDPCWAGFPDLDLLEAVDI